MPKHAYPHLSYEIAEYQRGKHGTLVKMENVQDGPAHAWWKNLLYYDPIVLSRNFREWPKYCFLSDRAAAFNIRECDFSPRQRHKYWAGDFATNGQVPFKSHALRLPLGFPALFTDKHVVDHPKPSLCFRGELILFGSNPPKTKPWNTHPLKKKLNDRFTMVEDLNSLIDPEMQISFLEWIREKKTLQRSYLPDFNREYIEIPAESSVISTPAVQKFDDQSLSNNSIQKKRKGPNQESARSTSPQSDRNRESMIFNREASIYDSESRLEDSDELECLNTSNSNPEPSARHSPKNRQSSSVAFIDDIVTDSSIQKSGIVGQKSTDQNSWKFNKATRNLEAAAEGVRSSQFLPAAQSVPAVENVVVHPLNLPSSLQKRNEQIKTNDTLSNRMLNSNIDWLSLEVDEFLRVLGTFCANGGPLKHKDAAILREEDITPRMLYQYGEEVLEMVKVTMGWETFLLLKNVDKVLRKEGDRK